MIYEVYESTQWACHTGVHYHTHSGPSNSTRCCSVCRRSESEYDMALERESVIYN